jgi:hypothetical protein
MKVIVERGRKWSFDELPEYSIAVDGSVEGPIIDNINHKYSFDHHGNCIRHSSTASCVQVLDALLLDFDPNKYNIYVNDVDGDTVIATALLLKPELSKNIYVQDITRVIGLIDSHGPSYPLNSNSQEIYHMFLNNVVNKVYELKKDKKYGEYDLEKLLFECIDKFYLMIEGKFINSKKEEINPEYFLTPETGKDWVMVQTSTRNILGYLYNHYSKIVVWEKQLDNSYSYSIAKKSEFVDFPVKEIINELNKIEHGWGGGSTIGGAPRNLDGSRSKLKPEEVMEIINNLIQT